MNRNILLLVSCSLIGVTAKAQIDSPDGSFNAVRTNNLTLRTNGTTRFTILGSGGNTGFVGINTTTPADRLTVNGNVRATQFITTSGTMAVTGTPNYTHCHLMVRHSYLNTPSDEKTAIIQREQSSLGKAIENCLKSKKRDRGAPKVKATN